MRACGYQTDVSKQTASLSLNSDLCVVAAYEKAHGAFADQVRAHFAGNTGGEQDAARDDAD